MENYKAGTNILQNVLRIALGLFMITAATGHRQLIIDNCQLAQSAINQQYIK